MFTQCPDCQTTFRVSTKVLQQAGGRVRCGGCGNAFNALEHLSEDDKHQADSGDQAAKQTTAPDDFTTDPNKELLETLDKLAGPEARIEDTGVEWRVLDEDNEDEIPPESGGEGETDDTSSARFVEANPDEEAPEKPVLHGRHGDLPESVFDTQESLDIAETEEASPPLEPSERRYDDSTVFPNEFGDEHGLDELLFPVEPETPKRRARDREAAQDTSAFDEAQADLTLSEPDDWGELLGEVDGADQLVEEDGEAIAGADSEVTLQVSAEEETVAEALAGEDVDEARDSDDDHADQTEEPATLDIGKELAGSPAEEDIEPERPEHVVPPQTEEEMTINQQIDEELLRATQTLDLFASARIERQNISQLLDEDSSMVETIIMEGETVRSALQEEHRKPDSVGSEFKNPERLEDTYSRNRGKIRGGRRASDPPSYTVIASVVLLGLLLVGQIIHQFRQSLATYGAFNHTIGPIYRVLGKPVTPEWDIKGWQFEATNGSIDESEKLLTIYSRIANKSSQPLPYPLVHVSLIDRWEEIIGSRVLEPSEYLAGDLDPRKPVPFGEDFTAVIIIESPSAEATGYKLKVCYRVAPGRVRCATEDFKD